MFQMLECTVVSEMAVRNWSAEEGSPTGEKSKGGKKGGLEERRYLLVGR